MAFRVYELDGVGGRHSIELHPDRRIVCATCPADLGPIPSSLSLFAASAFAEALVDAHAWPPIRWRASDHEAA